MSEDEEDRFYKQLGEKINHARRKRGLTQESLASLVGLSRTSVVNLEKGRQKLLTHLLLEFSRALQLNIHDLLPETHGSNLHHLAKIDSERAEDFVRAVLELSRTTSRRKG